MRFAGEAVLRGMMIERENWIGDRRVGRRVGVFIFGRKRNLADGVIACCWLPIEEQR